MRDWDVDGPLSVVCSLKSVSCCLMREPGTSPSVSGRLCVCVSQWWCVLPQKGNRKNSLEVYWDSSPDMSLLTLPSLNTLTHTHKETHTDTLGHGWYHLHLQLTHSLGLSGDTQARAPRAFPECQATRTHTQKHTQRCCPSRKGLDFHRIWFFLYSGAYSKKYRFQFKEKVKHSKTVLFWANRKCCVVPQGQHFVRISRCLIRRKGFFFSSSDYSVGLWGSQRLKRYRKHLKRSSF